MDALHTDGIGILEAGVSRYELYSIARHVAADNVDLRADDVLAAVNEVVDGDVLLNGVAFAVDAPMPDAGEVNHCFTERLAWDGPRMDAHSTRRGALFDERDLLAEFGRLDRSLLSSGPRAQDDHIYLFHL